MVAAVAAAVAAMPVLSGSSEAATRDSVAGSDPAALALLTGAVRAESTVTYDGIQAVTDQDEPVDDSPAGTGGHREAHEVLEVVEVSHLSRMGTVVVLRTPGTAVSRASFSAEGNRRPDLLVDLLQRSFRIVLGGPAVVADRPADVVVAARVDGSVAARFFVDRATGLLLRRDVVDAAGRTARSEEFLRLSLRVDRTAPPSPRSVSARPVSLDSGQVEQRRDAGWPCADRLGGLSLFDARQVAGAGADVLHITYSDGLSTVSVFVQRGRLDAAGVAGMRSADVGGEPVLVRPGRQQELMWSADGFVLTVVADAPADVVHAVVADLPHEQPPSGVSRVERGLSRVISWVNPFD